ANMGWQKCSGIRRSYLAPTSESNISAMNFFITDNNNPFANFGIFSLSVSLFLNTVSDSCS
ncbi:hypothetical protein ACK1O8_004460, partial [Salmonella enterica]